MRGLLKFLYRIHFFLLFLVLEVIAFSILIQNNHYHQSGFVNLAREVTGKFHQQMDDFKKYFSLQEENRMLANENARLNNILINMERADRSFYRSIKDSINNQKYYYTPARVINNSITKQHNYITINKGTDDGIQPEMAVISQEGVVGVIKGVSDNFATAISLLNRDFKISAKLKNSGYFGSLSWTGKGYKYGILTEIPLNAEVYPGDTIVTSGYSAIYPAGIDIGFVEDYEEISGSFYQIKVELAVNFKKVANVNIVSYLLKDEQEQLEEESLYD